MSDPTKNTPFEFVENGQTRVVRRSEVGSIYVDDVKVVTGHSDTSPAELRKRAAEFQEVVRNLEAAAAFVEWEATAVVDALAKVLYGAAYRGDVTSAAWEKTNSKSFWRDVAKAAIEHLEDKS